MSEPATLYRDGDEVTVYAPSEVKRMLADGWSLTDDYVPFAFREPELESVPDVVPVKRGRPRKAKQ